MVKKQRLELQTTTLWYYPSGQIPGELQGVPSRPGSTPAYVVWNLLQRYTRSGDLVVDPFCGGGTTLDVARGLGRRALGYDVHPGREGQGIFRADARALPLGDGVADFVFMDPPYSTHLRYSDDPRCIGHLDAGEPAYFEAMEQAFAEAQRVLRDRRYLAVFVGDSFEKRRGFVGIGARFFALLCAKLRPIDHVAVVRGNRTLERPAYHRAAAEGNFFLRGFHHLLIYKKELAAAAPDSGRRPRGKRSGR